MQSKKGKIARRILWTIATVLGWTAVILYIAAMGYEINIDIYTNIKSWENIANLYYVVAGIEILILWYFTLLYRKRKEATMMLFSLICCLTQIFLLINKVKI